MNDEEEYAANVDEMFGGSKKLRHLQDDFRKWQGLLGDIIDDWPDAIGPLDSTTAQSGLQIAKGLDSLAAVPRYLGYALGLHGAVMDDLTKLAADADDWATDAARQVAEGAGNIPGTSGEGGGTTHV